MEKGEGGHNRAIAKFAKKFEGLEGETKQRFDEFLHKKQKTAYKFKAAADGVVKRDPTELRKFLIAYENEKQYYPAGTKERILRLLRPRQSSAE